MKQMNILALDIASKCGWCTGTASGVWDLRPKRDESGGMRLIRLKSKVLEIIESEKINLVCFEMASGFHKNSLIVEAEMIGVLKSILVERNIDFRSYSTTAIKKFATNRGNAGKDLMVKAAREKLGYTGESDDEADAMWIYQMAAQEYKS